jgi:hypothetical protein
MLSHLQLPIDLCDALTYIQKMALRVGKDLLLPQPHGAWISFPPPFSLLPPFFQNFHNYSFFKIFIIIRFSSFDNISRRHRSRIIRVFCVHSFSTDTVSVEKLWTQNTRWVFIVLAHWNNSPRVEMSLHWDTLFWFWANQSAFSP